MKKMRCMAATVLALTCVAGTARSAEESPWYGGITITIAAPASCAARLRSAQIFELKCVVVTITGTSFTGATAVKFNTTSAATYTVVSDTTITATVSVPRKKMGTDPVWDLRVGSATLPNAFTVLA